MKVSIITVCYNSASTIEDTIKSVLDQTYRDIEYIIVDGASRDDTLSIIDRYKGRFARVVSEKDDGIYDAMNKGISMATGDIVGLLNSDDVYASPQVVEEVVRGFAESGVDAIFGDVCYVKRDDLDSVVRYWKSSPYKEGAFSRGWHPPHPALFIRRGVYSRYGLFDTAYDVSADFELMLRFIGKHEVKTRYLSGVLVKMRMGGVSNNSLKNMIVGNRNIKKAFSKNDQAYYFWYPFLRLVPKLLQYIVK